MNLVKWNLGFIALLVSVLLVNGAHPRSAEISKAMSVLSLAPFSFTEL